MDIGQLEKQYKNAGVKFMILCSFQCTNESTGNLEVDFDGQKVELPICEECVKELDRQPSSMVE